MSDSARYLVLCPMGIERTAIARGLARHNLPPSVAQVRQTGIGGRAIESCLNAEFNRETAWHGVILAGLCGGLQRSDPLPTLSHVLDRHGRSWPISRNGWAGPNGPQGDAHQRSGGSRGVGLLGVDELIPHPQDKQSLAEATGAHVVDMESHVFAAWCERAGVPWTVVRGVSDRPEDTLPPEVLNWITPAGDSRAARAVFDMLRKPSLIGHTVSAVRRSNQVLPLVAQRIAELIRVRESAE